MRIVKLKEQLIHRNGFLKQLIRSDFVALYERWEERDEIRFQSFLLVDIGVSSMPTEMGPTAFEVFENTKLFTNADRAMLGFYSREFNAKASMRGSKVSTTNDHSRNDISHQNDGKVS
jgi:hypothetical protein